MFGRAQRAAYSSVLESVLVTPTPGQRRASSASVLCASSLGARIFTDAARPLGQARHLLFSTPRACLRVHFLWTGPSSFKQIQFCLASLLPTRLPFRIV